MRSARPRAIAALGGAHARDLKRHLLDPGPFRVGASSYILSDIEGSPGGTLSNFSVAGTPPTVPTTPFSWTTARMASSEVHVTNVTTGKIGLPANQFGVGQAVRASARAGASSERRGDIFMINGGQLLHTADGLSLVPCSVAKGALGTCGSWTSTNVPPIVSAGSLASVEVNESGLVLTVFTMDMNAPTSPLPSFPQGNGTYCINGCVNSSGWLRILRSRSSDNGRSWMTDPQAVWSHQFAGHGTVFLPNGTAAGAAGGDFVAVLPSQILQLRSGKLLFLFEINTLATESGFTGAGGSFLEQPAPGGVI